MKTIFGILATTLLSATVVTAFEWPISEESVHQHNWKRVKTGNEHSDSLENHNKMQARR